MCTALCRTSADSKRQRTRLTGGRRRSYITSEWVFKARDKGAQAAIRVDNDPVSGHHVLERCGVSIEEGLAVAEIWKARRRYLPVDPSASAWFTVYDVQGHESIISRSPLPRRRQHVVLPAQRDPARLLGQPRLLHLLLRDHHLR